MAAAAKLLFEASFVPLSFNGGGGHREDAVRQNDGNLAAGRAGCCHQRWHHLKPKLIVSEPSNSGGIDRRVWGVPGGHTHARHRQRHRSVVEASQVAYTSSDDEQPTSSSLVETSGQVVFQRHRSKTKFQYASSLERLGLARLSSTESREAALAMGIEEIGEQGTPVCIGFTVMKVRQSRIVASF